MSTVRKLSTPVRVVDMTRDDLVAVMREEFRPEAWAERLPAVDTKYAARCLKVSRRTINRMCRSGELLQNEDGLIPLSDVIKRMSCDPVAAEA